ncbi:MAG: TonB-dependent receptor [Bacteroidales bacterium]|nr:TonB-dependent receptor [Bacteroidales bacterium]
MKKLFLFNAVFIAFCSGGVAFSNPYYSTNYTNSEVNFLISVKGKVVDENGTPLVGASIVVKGSTIGTITNQNGEFFLNINKGSVLIVSYIGYNNVEIIASENMTITLEENNNLEEIVVSSTRAGIKTPVAFCNVNQDDIKKQNFGKDIPFLLSTTPSVTITSDAGNGIGYTGIHVRGTDPSRINITANGIPINEAESSQVYWVNLADFASNTKSIQIQRGVGTSTNGAGAFGSTLNMQTESIGQQAYTQLDLSAGSFNSHKETLKFSSGLIKNHFGIQGRVSNISSDGYIDRASSQLNSYFIQTGYFSDKSVVKFITFNGKEKTYHAWNYPSKFEQEEYGRTFNSCGLYYDENGNIKYYDNQFDIYNQQHYQLLLDQYLSNNLTFNMGLHFTHGNGYYEEYKTNRKMAEYSLSDNWSEKSDLIRRKEMKNNFYGVVASLNYNNKNNINATLGGGWNKYDGNHFGNVLWAKMVKLSKNQEYYNNNGLKIDGNIYSKINYQICKPLNIFIDVQYRYTSTKMNGLSDKFNGENQIVFANFYQYHFFNPKAGFFVDLSKFDKIYASISKAHKEPTRNDYEDNINSKLKAEKLTDYELGYKHNGEIYSAGVNFYYMYYKNQFVLTGEINEIGEMIASNDNCGESYRTGIELEMAFCPIEWFRWDANATFSKNRNKNYSVNLTNPETWEQTEIVNLGNTPISFSPDIIANNIFTFVKNGFSASIQTQFIGKQYLTNNGIDKYLYNNKEYSMILNKYSSTNADISYTFNLTKLKEIILGISVYNIFNKKYDSNGWAYCELYKDNNNKIYAWSTDEYEAGFAPQAPCNFMIHLSFKL